MRAERPRSDALVFFGATGDLAYKKIFPALQAMARHGKLDFPVVGVAKSGWNRDQLVDRARASVTEYGGLDTDAATFEAVKAELKGSARPAHYLAIPPSMFATVLGRLAEAGLTRDARVV